MSAPQQIGIAVIQSDEKFVVGVRASTAALGGYAEFPGGKRENDETLIQTVRRECLEETGLDIEVLKLLTVTTFDYPHGKLELHFYLCQPASGHCPSLTGNFRWVEKWELAALKFPPANADALRQLVESDT